MGVYTATQPNQHAVPPFSVDPLHLFSTQGALNKLQVGTPKTKPETTLLHLRNNMLAVTQAHYDYIVDISLNEKVTASGIAKVSAEIITTEGETITVSVAQDTQSSIIWFIETQAGRHIYFYQKEVALVLSTYFR